MRSTELMPRSIVPLAAVAMLLLSACGGDKTSSTDSATAVAAAIADSARTGMTDSVASVEVIPPTEATGREAPVAGREPAPAPVATRPKPKPARSRPATRPSSNNAANTPAPAGPVVSSGTVAAGTTISVTNGPKVCSNTLAVGDRVTTTTSNVISASNGVSIPAGARIGLVVTESKTSGNQTDDSKLAFDVRSVTFGGETYTMSGDVSTDAIVKERKGGDGKKVAIGAADDVADDGSSGGTNRDLLAVAALPFLHDGVG